MTMQLRVHLAVAALGVALATPLAAQAQALRGVVLDDEGRPLAMAQVVALPGGAEALTGSDGRFVLRQMAAGEYRLRVALIGYAPVERAVRIGGGALEPLELRLKPSPLTLGGIQVTATGVARDPSAVTQATSQLSGRALERELSGTVAQTLKYQPGIAVRSNGPAASMPVMRGLTGDRVLVLQDGQRTSDLAGSADDHGVTIDPLAAQRVEVVRGPATLLYGNNALGGVVNVISGDVSGGVPLSAQLAVLAQTESAYPGYALSARALTPLGEAWSVTARGGIRSSGDMRIGDDPVFGNALPNTDARSRNGSVAVTHAAQRWTASLAVRGYDFSYGIPVPRGAEPVDLRGERIEVTGRTEWELAGAFPSVRADFTVQDYAHDELDSHDVVQQRFELGTRTLNVLVRQATLGPLRDGAWGASVLRKHYAATGPAALTPAADSRTWGVFGFQELSLGIAALQVGARFDRYAIESRTSTKFGDGVARSFDALSGSAGLRVPLGAALSIGITAARSFRAPTVEELFSAAPHAGTGSVEYGDPALDEERGRSFEAVAHLRTARVNGQVAAYHNRVHNYVQLAYVRDTVIAAARLPVFVYTQSPATLRGVEGSLEFALSPHTLAAARGDWLKADRDDGTPLSFMPPPRVGFTLRRDDGRISIGGDVHHELRQHRTGAANEAPTHAHTILRLDGGYRFRVRGRVHSISLRIDNLTNELHREATSRTKDFAPAAGRNVALGYRVVL